MSSSSVDEQVFELGDLMHKVGATALHCVAVAEFDSTMKAALPDINRQCKEITKAAANATKLFVRKRERKVCEAKQMCQGFINHWTSAADRAQTLYGANAL